MSSSTGVTAGGDALPSGDDPIEVQAKRLCTSIREAAAEHVRAKQSVEAERSQLVEEKQRMVQEFPKEKVKLDVGGQLFTASIDSLRRVSGSMLESMFSGRHELSPGQDGTFFIDRDGTHFRYILNYLRTGAVTAPADPAAKLELATEAEYYCLSALARALRAPALNLNELLGAEIVEERSREEMMRKAFAARAAQAYGDHHGLVSVFELETRMGYEHETRFPLLLASLRPAGVNGQRVIVDALAQFVTNFNLCHPNVLNRLQPILASEPVFIAGGSVLRALTKGEGDDAPRTSAWWKTKRFEPKFHFGEGADLVNEVDGKESDVDIFLHAPTAAEGNRIARRIFDALAVDGEHWVVSRSNGVINVMRFEIGGWNSALQQTVQLVLRQYQSPAEVLTGFDCDCICCGYDGTTVWALPRCLRALRTGINLLNPLHVWPNKPSYELRLGKYAARGWSIGVPGLDSRSIDHDQVRQSQLAELKGLARLLKVTFSLDASAVPTRDYSGANVPKEAPVAPADANQPDSYELFDYRRALAAFQTRERSLTRVLFPQNCKQLREPWADALSEIERMKHQINGYDDAATVSTFFPTAYNKNTAFKGGSWDPKCFIVGIDESDAPAMSYALRQRVWAEILDIGPRDPRPDGRPHLVPRTITWGDGSRSREYMNADVDPITLTSQYYTHAYIDDAGGIAV